MARSGTFYAILLVAFSVIRIVSVYPELSQTSDEPLHLARGLEVLENRDHFGDVQHPPLPRVLAALPLYLSGARVTSPIHPHSGETALRVNGDYYGNLSRSRTMLLPYFVIACFALWFLANSLFGAQIALLSLAFFTMLPVTLGHASVVGTDMPGAASFLLLVLSLIRFIEKKSPIRYSLLMASFALVLLSKYSALFFIVPVLGVLFLFKEVRSSRFWMIPRSWIAGSLAALFFVVWASFLFRLRPLWQAIPPLEVQTVAPENWPSFAYLSIFPLTDFVRSLIDIVISKNYPPAYFFGETSRSGFYMGLPAAILLKTPIPFLVLALVGVFHLVRQQRVLDWRVKLLGVCVIFRPQHWGDLKN